MKVLLDKKKLDAMKYKRPNGDCYMQHFNDNISLFIETERNSNVATGFYVKVRNIDVKSVDDLNLLLKLYKTLKANIEDAKIKEIQTLLNDNERNYLKILFSNTEKSSVSAIAIIIRRNQKFLRVRYANSKLYSYIPIESGFEQMEYDRNYTLKELNIWKKEQ